MEDDGDMEDADDPEDEYSTGPLERWLLSQSHVRVIVCERGALEYVVTAPDVQAAWTAWSAAHPQHKSAPSALSSASPSLVTPSPERPERKPAVTTETTTKNPPSSADNPSNIVL